MSKNSISKYHKIALISVSIIAASVFLCTPCLAYQVTPPERTEGELNSDRKGDAQIELARQQFEFQKELENKKLDIERQKAWLTGGSILVPLLIGSLGIYLQVKSAFNLKAQEFRKSQELKELEFKSAFELKAAEIVLNTTSPKAGKNKAEALQELFPGRLSPDFAEKLEQRALVPLGEQRPLAFEHTQVLLQMLADNLGKETEVIELWRKVYPYYQRWLDRRFPQKPTERVSDDEPNLEADETVA